MSQTYRVIPFPASDSSWIIEDGGVRCFLLAGRERALLIDTGMSGGDLKSVVSGLTSLPVQVVNTHADPDHIACNGQFETVLMHPSEMAVYHHNQNRGGRPLSVWEGDVLDLGGRTLRVVLTPGHTPGSISLLDPDNRSLIGGDGVQDGSIFLFGPHRDLAAYRDCLARLCAMKDRFDLIYPSHASCPVTPDILDRLLDGVDRMLSGKLTGTELLMWGKTPVRCFDLGPAKLLYDGEPQFWER